MAERSVSDRPEEILRLTPEEADELFDHLERTVPTHPPVVTLPVRAGTEAVVFGDTHGDWRSTLEAVRLFERGPEARWLIGLGDYVDRTPTDSGEGSVANALFLLGLASRFPDRVYLLQGNHETARRIAVFPHQLPEEVDALWGPDATRYHRLLGLLERGPLALTTAGGAYLAHGGFPRGALGADWAKAVDPNDEERLIEIVWSECTATRSRRGVVAPWGEDDLTRFLAGASLRLVLRGHDPDLTGRPLYGNRCLTLQTTRIYERFGGVIVAHLPLGEPVRSTSDLVIEHLPTEGRRYPSP